ncbi:MAG: hypothetical protein R3D00_14695 [Bacteroidia bacterium]
MNKLFRLLWIFFALHPIFFAQAQGFRLDSVTTITTASACESIEVDSEGNILLLDTDQSQLYKLFRNTGYDSAIVIGGKSFRNEGFLHPVKMSVKNRQNLYLLDDVERRIILLNTNFKLAGEFNFLQPVTSQQGFREETDIYPVNFDISVDGTQFVLNQLDNKIYVFYPSGGLQLSFGGLDYGQGVLKAPVDVQVNEKNYVFVSDTIAGEIMVFDNFGSYRTTRKPQTDFPWKKFHLAGNTLLCFDQKNIYLENMLTGQYYTINAPNKVLVTDLKLKGEYLYLLQKNAVNLYRIGE